MGLHISSAGILSPVTRHFVESVGVRCMGKLVHLRSFCFKRAVVLSIRKLAIPFAPQSPFSISPFLLIASRSYSSHRGVRLDERSLEISGDSRAWPRSERLKK